MGFKVDSSFLKYLTMGALGADKVITELKILGFEPVELERYCTSNKIWATKVKRLRIADLLCVRTGLRVEVRAKSKLAIRMSDAPNNPDRAWDAGLRDQDIIALIACIETAGDLIPVNKAVYFKVEELRKSVGSSALGQPKSASEGAERDRTWPAVVPSCRGSTVSVSQTKLVVMMETGHGKTRRQTYTLNGKRSYVKPGDTFDANVTILAGAPAKTANLSGYLSSSYNPINELGSASPVERYAGAKALRFRSDLQPASVLALENLISKEIDPRVALEAAGSAAALGSSKGRIYIESVLESGASEELGMEAIFILTEIKGDFARSLLLKIANSTQLAGDERRQAAVWGLGKNGLKSYELLVPFIFDQEENVAFHAITAFSSDTPRAVIEKLIDILLGSDQRAAAAASEALKFIGSVEVLEALAASILTHKKGQNWLIATIGRLDPNMVRGRLSGTLLLDQLEPMLLLAQGGNWLAGDDMRANLSFLSKQML